MFDRHGSSLLSKGEVFGKRFHYSGTPDPDDLVVQVGFESYAHRVTSEKMAETPEEVLRFLEALSNGVREKAAQEVGGGFGFLEGCFVLFFTPRVVLATRFFPTLFRRGIIFKQGFCRKGVTMGKGVIFKQEFSSERRYFLRGVLVGKAFLWKKALFSNRSSLALIFSLLE